MRSPANAPRRHGPPPAKRRRIGAPSHDDSDIPTPQSQANAPSASALSTRVLPPDHIPSLVTICIHVFASKLLELSRDPSVWDAIHWWIKAIPDTLVPRVFAVLRQVCPANLTHAFIIAHFLRGSSITLDSSLPGVKNMTISAISDSPARATLQELELSGFEKVPDTVVANVVAKLPSLRTLILRHCTKVGPKTVQAAVKNCPRLTVVNFNYTAVTPVSLAPFLLAHSELEVLKLAGIPNWTDATVTKLWAALEVSNTQEFRLPKLRTLNLRQMPLNDGTINSFLTMCPNLKRLDLSFTLVRHPPLLLSNTSLEKLNLTSTAISGHDLLTVLGNLTGLKSLSVGALGGGQATSAAISNATAMTMTDQTLRDMTDALAKNKELERVNMVGNTKLGLGGRQNSAIADFIRRVGRRCKNLNMASIPSLRSSDLEGLLVDDLHGDAPQLRTLNLNNTAIDDEAAPYIASCTFLETLELSGTKITNEGLYPIIDACAKLEKLNLTSCRGVGVVDRRRFFEVWEEQWHDKAGARTQEH